jgi:hypothetical protein
MGVHKWAIYKFPYISEVHIVRIITAIIALIMDAVSASEASVNFYKTTLSSIPEGCHLHSRVKSKELHKDNS